MKNQILKVIPALALTFLSATTSFAADTTSLHHLIVGQSAGANFIDIATTTGGLKVFSMCQIVSGQSQCTPIGRPEGYPRALIAKRLKQISSNEVKSTSLLLLGGAAGMLAGFAGGAMLSQVEQSYHTLGQFLMSALVSAQKPIYGMVAGGALGAAAGYGIAEKAGYHDYNEDAINARDTINGERPQPFVVDDLGQAVNAINFVLMGL